MTRSYLSADPLRIGLIADSHGRLASTLSCIRHLNRCGVDAMMHLGDIFDSLGHRDLTALLNALGQNRILSVKGNNDYQLENALTNGVSFSMPFEEKKRLHAFLKELPMKREISGICFTHSLPYDSVRSFYEPIDTGFTDRAEQVFNTTPYRIIFCGHSHRPVVFRRRAGKVTRGAIPDDTPLYLRDTERYIIIIGSAENGECGFFDMALNIYRRIRI